MNAITQEKREALIAQLQKIQAMTEANGCTESEAFVAAGKAQALMDEYGLTLGEIKATSTPDDLCEKAEFQAEGRKTVHEVQFTSGKVAEYTNCRVWKTGNKICFFGLAADVQIARYLSGVFQTAMDTEFARYWRTARDFSETHGRTARKSFMLGMARRLRERLAELIQSRAYEQELQPAASDCRTLVVVKKQVVEKAFKALGMNLRRGSSGHCSRDGSSYDAGFKAGNNVTISHGGLNGRASAHRLN